MACRNPSERPTFNFFFLFPGQGAEEQFSANSGLLTQYFFCDIANFAFLHTGVKERVSKI